MKDAASSASPPDADAAPRRVSRHGNDASDAEYGVHRLRREPVGRASPVPRSADGGYGWCVVLKRRGRVIQMAFWDTTYGGRDGALFVARAYRDAVATVVPATSRREKRERPRGEARRPDPGEVAASRKRGADPAEGDALGGGSPSDAAAGRSASPPDVPPDLPRVAGVNYQPPLRPGHAAYWVAQTEVSSRGSGKGRRRRAKYFNVTKLGHVEAHARAVAARRAMLDALEGVDDPFLLAPEAHRLHRASAGVDAGAEGGRAAAED